MKPIPLLIDTNILRRLISKTEFSDALLQLQFLVKKKAIMLFAPEILRKEWKKHREEEKQHILSSLRTHKTHIRFRSNLQDPGLPLFEEDLRHLETKLLSQLDLIDELLAEKSVAVSVSEQMILLMYRQQEDGKAPFLDPRKNNMADAKLLFSSLEAVQQLGLRELYFVSDNVAEFAFSGSEPPQLHPDIEGLFPDVTIHYDRDIRDTYKRFDQLGLPRYQKKEVRDVNRVEKAIEIDRTKPILAQVHDYLDKRFQDLSILPKKMIINHYPFVLGERLAYLSKPFTIVTDNREVYDLFTSLQFEGNEVTDTSGKYVSTDDDKQKARDVMRWLTHNFLYYVGFKHENEVELSHPFSTATCECALCLFKNLRWADLLQAHLSGITDQSQSLLGRMRIAYGFYKVRDYVTAARLFDALRNEAKAQKGILYYIINFNLQHLGNLMLYSYWDDSDIKQCAEELNAIDLNVIYRECRTAENRQLLSWIHDKEFYRIAFSRLLEYNAKIRDLYYSNSTGSQENTRSLLEEYYQIDAFLNHNSIIYDVYAEFDTLTEIFTEGVIASHNLHTLMGGRLSYFHDYLFERLLLAGKADTFRNYFNRYRLDQLQYRATNADGFQFLQRFQQFIRNYDTIKTVYAKQDAPQNHLFWDEFTNIVQSGLTLLAMSAVKGEAVDNFAQVLISFLSSQEHLHHHHLAKSIRFFLHRKYDELSEATLQRFVWLGIENKDFHRDDEYIDLLEDIFRKKEIHLSISEEQFALFSSSFLLDGKETEQQPSLWFTGMVYTVSDNSEQKQAIRNWILHELQTNFQVRRYYLACMFDIIAPAEPLMSHYLEEIQNVAAKGQQPRFMPSHEYYSDSRIDHFFNYCFKYGFIIPVTLQSALSLLSPYYQWLLNMDSFDYRHFDTNWITHHFTIYFKRYYRQSEALRNYLRHYIRDRPHSNLARTFVLIYEFDN